MSDSVSESAPAGKSTTVSSAMVPSSRRSVMRTFSNATWPSAARSAELRRAVSYCGLTASEATRLNALTGTGTANKKLVMPK